MIGFRELHPCSKFKNMVAAGLIEVGPDGTRRMERH